MKFSFKLLLWTIVLLAAALGFSGFYFVNYVFETSLAREVGQASDESSILSFAFETAALNVPAQYGILPDNRVEEIASNLEAGGHSASRFIRISDEKRDVLYASNGFGADDEPSENMIHDLLDIPYTQSIVTVLTFGVPDEERREVDPSKLLWEKVHIGKWNAGE